MTTFKNDSQSAAPPVDVAWLERHLFFSGVDATFAPLACFLQNLIKEKHDVDCSVRFEFGDADYLGHDGSWANGFLTVTTIDRTPWMFCCTAVGTGIFLCSFEGERLYFEDCRLEDCLEELLPILVREVEEYLGLSYTTH